MSTFEYLKLQFNCLQLNDKFNWLATPDKWQYILVAFNLYELAWTMKNCWFSGNSFEFSNRKYNSLCISASLIVKVNWKRL